jgi:hypothetical protein
LKRDPDDDFERFKAKWGSLIIWARMVDRANAILREGDYVVIGWYTAAERELSRRIADQARQAVKAEHDGHAADAAYHHESTNRIAEVLAGALILRLRLPHGVMPGCFPFDEDFIYLPRVMAEAAGLPYVEREQLRDIPEMAWAVPKQEGNTP